MTYSWTYKEIGEMLLSELKECLAFTENTLAKYRNMKRWGYDSYEINPKIRNLVQRKKDLKVRIKELKTIAA